MKHLPIFLSAVAAIALTACSSDEATQGFDEREAQDVTFTFTLPDAPQTRAAAFKCADSLSSARGGITNTDINAYDLRYIIAVYDNDPNTNVQYIAPKIKTLDQYAPYTYSIRLTPGHIYRVVAWADFVKQGSEADLHYDTSDLTNITCKDKNWEQVNDESRDAYFITDTIEVKKDWLGKNLVLKRPFAKVRVVTTDWGKGLLEMPDSFIIRYHDCTRFTSMNILNGKATGAPLTGNLICKAGITCDENGKKFYKESYDKRAEHRTLTVDYLMVNNEENAIHFSFEARAKGERMFIKDVTTTIPTKRNYLTTLLGNFLSVDALYTVSIDEAFDGKYDVETSWDNENK